MIRYWPLFLLMGSISAYSQGGRNRPRPMFVTTSFCQSQLELRNDLAIQHHEKIQLAREWVEFNFDNRVSTLRKLASALTEKDRAEFKKIVDEMNEIYRQIAPNTLNGRLNELGSKFTHLLQDVLFRSGIKDIEVSSGPIFNLPITDSKKVRLDTQWVHDHVKSRIEMRSDRKPTDTELTKTREFVFGHKQLLTQGSLVFEEGFSHRELSLLSIDLTTGELSLPQQTDHEKLWESIHAFTQVPVGKIMNLTSDDRRIEWSFRHPLIQKMRIAGMRLNETLLMDENRYVFHELKLPQCNELLRKKEQAVSDRPSESQVKQSPSILLVEEEVGQSDAAAK